MIRRSGAPRAYPRFPIVPDVPPARARLRSLNFRAPPTAPQSRPRARLSSCRSPLAAQVRRREARGALGASTLASSARVRSPQPVPVRPSTVGGRRAAWAWSGVRLCCRWPYLALDLTLSLRLALTLTLPPNP